MNVVASVCLSGAVGTGAGILLTKPEGMNFLIHQATLYLFFAVVVYGLLLNAKLILAKRNGLKY